MKKLPFPKIWKILLIDDEPDIREVIGIVLADAGYQVETASDGATGLSLCEKISPHIVITDIRMPGMDGLEVLENIKRKFPDIEVIVITAFGEIDLAIRALQLDASDFINKPINESALFTAIDRAKKRFSDRRELRDYAKFLEAENAQTAQELIESYAFRDNLIESSLDGIIGCDINDRIIIFNKNMQRLLSYTGDEVINIMFLNDLLPLEDLSRFASDLENEKYGGKDRLFLYETILMSKENDRILMQVSAIRLFANERPNGLVCFFRDLREIRKLEQELADQTQMLHQDKMMSLGRMAASVVHEINNPLAGILNYIHLMQKILKRGRFSEADQEKFSNHLELIGSETSRCAKIISNLLSFSRSSRSIFKLFDIEELLNRCRVLSQHKLKLQNIRFTVSAGSNLPVLKGDDNLLQQCIINLIFNAADAMPNGGFLNLIADYDAGQRKVNIFIKDTGSGICESDLPHIFEPFFTTKKDGYGVGLGLSTVYGIIKRHNGNITVDSQMDKGSTFQIELPVASQ